MRRLPSLDDGPVVDVRVHQSVSMGDFQVDQALAELLIEYKLAVIGDEHVTSEMAFHEPKTDLVGGRVAEHDHEPAGTIGTFILIHEVGSLVR
ncbi:hypothetical protein D3C79_924390 [compost metagenome]